MDSRLSIIMETFAISGKDLSGLLHIDSSLVSKWRSGKRNLKPNSVYTNQIIKHIMALDRNNKFAKVRMLLSNEYVNIYKCSENEIALFLKDWLTSPKTIVESTVDYFDEIKNLKNASSLTTYSMTGNKGRQQAVQFFLKYAQHISPNAEMWLYTTEDVEWFYESKSFIDEWLMRNISLLKEDNKIKIIHPISSSYENLAISMLIWMPLHMTGKTKAYFIPMYKYEQLAYTYLLIKDHMALYNWTPKQQKKELNTYITHETQLVKDIEVMLESYFDISTLIFERYSYETKDDYLNYLISVLEKENSEYHWCSSFPLCVLSEELLGEVLSENGMTEMECKQNIESFNLISDLNTKSRRFYFIDIEHLKLLLNQDQIAMNTLSFTVGQKITVTKELFIKMIQETLEKINETEDVKICLATSDLFQRQGDTEIIAKENTSVHFSNIQGDLPRMLVTKEIMVVTALYSYFEELWNTTPYICRNKEYVTKRIFRLLHESAEKQLDNHHGESSHNDCDDEN